MSFFGKFKGGSGAGTQTSTTSPTKKDPNAPQPTALEKHLRDVTGPVRSDGSDKFFGFENYGSTWYDSALTPLFAAPADSTDSYCNSVMQCLYYSAPFRENVLSFPPKEYLDTIPQVDAQGKPLAPRSTSQIPFPNATSPARKDPPPPQSPGTSPQKPEETKDSPEYKKRMVIKSGPVLDMIHDRSNSYGMDESLFTAMKDMFDAIKGNSARYGVVSPHKFLEILRRENEMFRSAMHQDAHEFLNLVLNQVVDSVEMFSKQHPALNGAPPAVSGDAAANGSLTKPTNNGLDTRWVHDLFEGLLTSETRCLTCENTSQRDEPFLDLSVDLSAHTSVTSCLRKFSEEEMLCERNKFHCDNCGGLQEAEKRMKIKRLPRVLALHLKRFKYTEDLQRLQKVFHRVAYPFYLRLFNTTDEAEDPDRLYELYAVVVHIGGGPYHGHYVAIIKTQDHGWLLYDDELVEPVNKAYVQNFFGGEPIPGVQDARQLACAYVLFYQETTLEAMLKVQEMESQQATTATAAANGRTSDVDTTKETLTSLGLNGLTPSQTVHSPPIATSLPVSTPVADHTEYMHTLSHAVTAPEPLSPESEVPPVATATVERTKTRKELKAEEKERKAAAKAEAKAIEEKRRQASTRRMEAWKKAQDEMAAAIEASKQTAANEAQSRGDDPSIAPKDPSTPSTTLSRFRHGSMSLRNKPKWMGGGGGGSSGGVGGGTTGNTTKLAPSLENGTASTTTTTTNTNSTSNTAGAEATRISSDEKPLPALPVPVPAAVPTVKTPAVTTAAEEKSISKRNRFSLGRKRSQAMG